MGEINLSTPHSDNMPNLIAKCTMVLDITSVVGSLVSCEATKSRGVLCTEGNGPGKPEHVWIPERGTNDPENVGTCTVKVGTKG